MGEHGLCCQGENDCRCQPVECGISSIHGDCVCGAGMYIDSFMGSCEGTASTCCTQNTGYCYCEDGCENRFESMVVSSCDRTTFTARCSAGQTQVSACQ